MKMSTTVRAHRCAVIAAGFLSAAALAQSPDGFDPNYTAPRTPDGYPDLQGVWSNAILTPRITSYNVCYTKLLRVELTAFDEGDCCCDTNRFAAR